MENGSDNIASRHSRISCPVSVGDGVFVEEISDRIGVPISVEKFTRLNVFIIAIDFPGIIGLENNFFESKGKQFSHKDI